MKCFKTTAQLLAFVSILVIGSPAIAGASHDNGSGKKPNILFVIMDDVGIDQLELFGYGGYGQFGVLGDGALTAPKTPVLSAIASGGVKFRNVWATPECSPSRVSMFTGRYALHHNVMAALLPADLANSQQSPFETTIPSILRKAGYKSALFGKSHFTNSPTNPQTPSTDPYGGTAVTQLGWDYFEGWYDGGPNAIDTTAGGIVQPDPTTGLGPYSCGYVPNTAIDATNGANKGACYQPSGACRELTASAAAPSPGLSCLVSGGILKPNAKCGKKSGLNFDIENGYYVSQKVINQGQGKPARVTPVSDPAGRGYRTTLETNFAINWIKAQPKSTPWMATVAFASAHTPYQPAPSSLVYSTATTLGHSCKDTGVESRALMTGMIESLDKELGRLLVETGIARRNPDGSIVYDPGKSNTVIVVVADNGSYALNVRAPFDPANSKGTVYQTGVWVPLIVSGPMVVSPGREEESMVNIVDLFSLFGDVAGLNVRSQVPSTHALDAHPIYPYLVNINQPAIRSTNFTQYGENQRKTSFQYGACVVPLSSGSGLCTILFPSKSVCEINYAGAWYGSGTTNLDPQTAAAYPNGFSSCCQVNQYLVTRNPAQPATTPLADYSYAVRNSKYKLVQQSTTNYNPAQPALGSACLTQKVDEFYQVDENPVSASTPLGPTLDRPSGSAANNLLPQGQAAGQGAGQLSGNAQTAYIELTDELNRQLSSAQPCPGDVNLDGIVNGQDLTDQSVWRVKTKGASTWWDLNFDGYTNQSDRDDLSLLLGTKCQLPR